MARGESLNSISKRLGVSRAALREWRDRTYQRKTPASTCPRCRPEHADLPRASYAHLLGLYLGDGCVSLLRKGVYSLRIACDDKYPRLIDEAAETAHAVLEPWRGRIAFVVLGGDRAAIRELLAASPQLGWLAERAITRFFAVPEPRRRQLERLPYDLYAAEVEVKYGSQP